MLWGGRIGVRYISCHAGVFPEVGTREFADFAKDMKFLARFAADLGQDFLFETGPESAETLQTAMEMIDEDNTGINFDPANLLIYNQTEPTLFVERLFHKIRLIHCKDGKRPEPGQRRGSQFPLGQGDTHFEDLLRMILSKGFRGPLILERETPHDDTHFDEQRKAFSMLKQIRSEHQL